MTSTTIPTPIANNTSTPNNTTVSPPVITGTLPQANTPNNIVNSTTITPTNTTSRLKEDVAIDTVFAVVPGYDGSNATQVFLVYSLDVSIFITYHPTKVVMSFMLIKIS